MSCCHKLGKSTKNNETRSWLIIPPQYGMELWHQASPEEIKGWFWGRGQKHGNKNQVKEMQRYDLTIFNIAKMRLPGKDISYIQYTIVYSILERNYE